MLINAKNNNINIYKTNKHTVLIWNVIILKVTIIMIKITIVNKIVQYIILMNKNNTVFQNNIVMKHNINIKFQKVITNVLNNVKNKTYIQKKENK